MKILVVDDLAYGRRALRAVFLSGGFDVATAEDGQVALALCRTDPPDVVLTDILMPRLDGFQLCHALKADPELAAIPVVLYTGSYTDEADRELGRQLGAAAYLVKPLEPRELLREVGTVIGTPDLTLRPRRALGDRWAEAYAERLAAKLQDKVREVHAAYERLEETYTGTVAALSLALASREGTSALDAERPAHLARLLCERVAPELAADPNVFRGFLLHDVGKLTLPDGLLTKADVLTAAEWALLRRVPGIAADILQNVPGLGAALPIIRHHRERWDGTGYPDGLAGEAIPLGARIFAIADSFEAMTAGRRYRSARPPADALSEIRLAAGTQFDPALTAAFSDLVSSLVVDR